MLSFFFFFLRLFSGLYGFGSLQKHCTCLNRGWPKHASAKLDFFSETPQLHESSIFQKYTDGFRNYEKT